MSGILSLINSSAGVVLAAVLNDFWLALGVAALAWLALKLLTHAQISGINAATRYSIWWVVLGVVLVLPVAPRLATAWHSRQQVNGTPAVPSSPPPAVLLPPIAEPALMTVQQERVGTWPLWAFGLWAAILMLRLAQLARSYVFLRGVKRQASIAPRALPNCGVRRPVQLLISSEISSPMAVGFLRPAVMIPESLLEELSEPELDHVLLHEIAHIARRDDWTNLAARLAGASLALHPVAVWILRQIEWEREMACDDFVVAQTGEARVYARSLARMVELRWARRGEVLASGIFGRSSKIGDRIEILLRRGRDFSPYASVKRVASSGLVLVGFVMAGALAPRWIAFAQQPRLSFETVAIRPGDPTSRKVVIGALAPRRFTTTNATLTMLIGFAYGLRNRQVAGGPDWVASDKFDIEAVLNSATPVSGPPASGQMELVVQSLLKDRFKVAFHRETRDEPVFDLVVDNGGLKLKETDAGPSDPPGLFGSLSSHLTGVAATPALLINALSQILGTAVIDKTGLAGKYDFALTFRPEASQPAVLGPPAPDAQLTTNRNHPSIFTALQEQLGLRLESAKGPVEVLVIDHAEKPDAN